MVVNEQNLYVLDNDRGDVIIFQYDSENQTHERHTTFRIKDYKKSEWNTIHVSMHYIFFADCISHTIEKYFHDGTYANKLVLEQPCTFPRFCGSDSDDNVLIADSQNNRFIALNNAERSRILKIKDFECPVFGGFVNNTFKVMQYHKKTIVSFVFH